MAKKVFIGKEPKNHAALRYTVLIGVKNKAGRIKNRKAIGCRNFCTLKGLKEFRKGIRPDQAIEVYVNSSQFVEAWQGE